MLAQPTLSLKRFALLGGCVSDASIDRGKLVAPPGDSVVDLDVQMLTASRPRLTLAARPMARAASAAEPWPPAVAVRKGFTLLEILVVLILLGLTVGLVAPSFRLPEPPAEAALAPLIRTARESALRRGETVELQLEPSGQWRIDGRSSARDGPLASGRLAAGLGAQLVLEFSPIGTCAPTVRSAPLPSGTLDPLTCALAVR